MRSSLATLAVCLSALVSVPQASAAEKDALTGTWSGSFEIHFTDGRVQHDTAWLVLQQSGASVSGTAGPNADQQAPIRETSVSGDELKFVADSTQGKVLHFALHRAGEKMAGEAIGDIGDDHVRVVIDVSRAASAAAAASAVDPLYEKVLALDTAMFDAFNKCNDPAQLARHAAFFAPDVEFYHDHGGLSMGVAAVIESTRQNVCGKFRRELDRASFRVYPIPGYGAMAFGTHRFCHTATTCEGAGDFSVVWREKDGVWQVTRALSYAHRSLK